MRAQALEWVAADRRRVNRQAVVQILQHGGKA